MWDSATKKQFRLALIDVYRDYSLLEIFVADELGERLKEITHEQSLKVVAFRLLEWAESQKRLDELFAAFCRENPRHVLALQPPSSSLSPPPEPPPTPPPVLQYRRDVVRTEPMVPPAPVNRGDSTVISSPKQQPKEKSRSRDTVQAKYERRLRPRRKAQIWWKSWTATLTVSSLYVVIGVLLSLSNAPTIMWYCSVSAAFMFAASGALLVNDAELLASVLALVLALVWASVWAWAWALAFAGSLTRTLVFALSLTAILFYTWMLPFAWSKVEAWAADEWTVMYYRTDQITITLAVISGLSLALGALLAAPFDITIPVDWSILERLR